MSRGELILVCVIVSVIGFVSGWSARAVSADHRYIRAHAERTEAGGR